MLCDKTYDVSMRTTLTIDDDLAATLKESSRRSGRPFKQLLNETLRAGLQAQQAPQGRSGTAFDRRRWAGS